MQILISSGPENVERAVLGFSLAAAAVCAGTQVLLFLVMDGARWALKSEGNKVDVPGFQPISELIDAIQTGGGTIEVCSNCAQGTDCSVLQGQLRDQMRPGIVTGGLVKVATRIGMIPTVAF